MPNQDQQSTVTEPTQTTVPEPVTMEPQGQAAAAGDTAEDTVKAYQALFEKQRDEMDSLKKANQSLQSQIGILLRNGASVSAQEPEPAQATQQAQASVSENREPYVSLADLGKEIGKRDYASHNTQSAG